jgi:hypothetical protein
VLEPAARVEHDNLDHGHGSPHPLPEIAVGTFLAVPQFEPRGDDAGH